MAREIRKFSDLEKERKAASRRSRKNLAKIQKDVRGFKESFSPAGIISNMSGFVRGPRMSWAAIALAIVRKARKALK